MGDEVDAVVFDIGGVLLDWDPRYLYRSLIADEAELEAFLGQVCTLEWNGELDAGRSFDEACAELAAAHPEKAELVHAWRRQDEMIAGEVPGTSDIVRELRQRGVPLFLLTNMPADVFARRSERFEVLRLFDGAVVSGHEGVVKPSPAIFELLTTRFGLEPRSTLFVDDSAVNVEAARALGFRAHRFTDAGRLAAQLADLGLLK